MQKSDLRLGAENLLITCGGLSPGDRLLILHEEAGQAYYDPALIETLLSCATDLGIRARRRAIPFDPMGGQIPRDLIADMKRAERTVFLSRMGDQIRFDASLAELHPIMTYALDLDMLASGFGRAHYAGFVALKNAVNALFAGADTIRVRCPLGTDFSGPGPGLCQGGAADVSVTRFPMSVFAPVPARGFSGVVVQDGFLVGTGSKYYTPYGCDLQQPLSVHFTDTRLSHFSGHEMDVHCAQMHYEKVGQMFDLDPMTMHSWHAGIHPGCAYTAPAAENFERWSGGAFGNPRLMHFHTCGHYAPGEISLNVLDPTITIDGVAVWNRGVFDPCLVPGGAELLAQYPSIQAVFDAPAQQVGQGPNGRLMGATYQ